MNPSFSGLPVRGLIVALLLSAGCSAPPVYTTSFETPPAEEGWQCKGGVDVALPGPADGWVSEDASHGQRCIAATAGMWLSPPMAMEPLKFYRVDFQSKTPSPGYWVAQFFDADGREIPADDYSNVFASDDWARNVDYVLGRTGMQSARLGFRAGQRPMLIDDVSVRAALRSEVRRWADALYATLPPVAYRPDADRWQYLQATRQKLRRRQPLRLVLLGDSIANDLGNSHFHLLIERMYPGSQITLIPSVRGGAGCWYYKERGRIKRYVLDYQPDLLMIAGVSHHFDVESVRSVVRQVRDGSNCDILVMTGALSNPQGGSYSPSWQRFNTRDEALRKLKEFADALAAAGRQDGFATLDLRGLWEGYLETSPRPADWFHRDPVHGNSRGKQIIGRIVARFFQRD